MLNNNSQKGKMDQDLRKGRMVEAPVAAWLAVIETLNAEIPEERRAELKGHASWKLECFPDIFSEELTTKLQAFSSSIAQLAEEQIKACLRNPHTTELAAEAQRVRLQVRKFCEFPIPFASGAGFLVHLALACLELTYLPVEGLQLSNAKLVGETLENLLFSLSDVLSKTQEREVGATSKAPDQSQLGGGASKGYHQGLGCLDLFQQDEIATGLNELRRLAAQLKHLKPEPQAAALNLSFSKFTARSLAAFLGAFLELLVCLPNFQNFRPYLLGKKSVLKKEIAQLARAGLREESKPYLNSLQTAQLLIEGGVAKALKFVQHQKALQNMCRNMLDVSYPIDAGGGLHPLSYALEEVVDIFAAMGFMPKEGPEVITDHQNFGALNFADNHPARAAHDTFYVKEDQVQDRPPGVKSSNLDSTERYLLRTHTSSVQISAMEELSPPIKIIAPGRVYRSDSDATHSPMFHQIEALYIAKDASIATLKGVLENFCLRFFELDELPMRFRPSYFPFTTPSLEVDISCSVTPDNRIQIGGGGQRWLEILGCGMVHENVIRNAGLDPKEWRGFAFGMGLERMTMLKYGFSDLRDFYKSEYRWLMGANFKLSFDIFRYS